MVVYDARVDGRSTQLEIMPDGLVVDDQSLSWVDLDGMKIEAHRVQICPVGGVALTLSHFGNKFDRFVSETVEARGRARRAALLQWTGDSPLDVFDGKRGDDRVRIYLFPDGLTVEPHEGVPGMLPLSCLVGVQREGYNLVLVAKGLPSLHVRHLGNRTDEFLARLERAKRHLQTRTEAAYTELADGLAGFVAVAPDGWAVDETNAGQWWPVLRTAVGQQHRSAQIDLLAGLSGSRLRLGIKCGPGLSVLPFALAPVGNRVALEATNADDRATFVFEVDDLDRLNAVLLATSFRREAISAPEAQLGRWALAVRTLDVVRWARSVLVDRVIHDANWERNIRAILSG